MAIRDYHPALGSKEDVIEKYGDLVQKAANNLKRQASALRISYEDVCSEGYIGLLIAFNGYDPEKGTFEPYAYKTIRGTILRFFLKHGRFIRLPQTIASKASTVYTLSDRYTVSEMAALTGYREIDIKRVQELLANRLLSLDTAAVNVEPDGDFTLYNLLPSYQDYSIVYVREWLERLPTDLYHIVQLRLKGYDYDEIASILGCSLSTVRRRKALIVSHIPDEEREKILSDIAAHKQKQRSLTKEVYDRLRAEGKTVSEIEKMFGYKDRNVYTIAKRWETNKSPGKIGRPPKKKPVKEGVV